MKIVIVEDDYLQAQGIQKALDKAFPTTEFHVVSTESQFQREFADLAAHPPDVVIMDVMLRWTDPAPDMPLPPKDVREGGFFRAGLRCKSMMEADPRTAAVPVAIYTVLDSARLPGNIDFVSKESDIQPLVEKIKTLVGARA